MSQVDIKPMTKGQLKAELKIGSYVTLKRLILRVGIDWTTGYQIFTANEVAKIFKVYDYDGTNE